MSNTGENAELISSLNAWAPLVDQGLEVPAAGEVMRNAATALIKADARIAELEALTVEQDKSYGILVKQQRERAETAEQELERIKAINVKHCEAVNTLLVDGSQWQAKAETAETLLEEARRALAPFIRLADKVFSDGKNATVADEVTLWCFNDTDITFGDLRRVRATLDRIKGKEPTLLEEARKALVWALADMNGETKYDNPLQRIACEDRARATLDRIGK